MLKALFFDMDDTLCDTNAANEKAKEQMGRSIEALTDLEVNGKAIADEYVTLIYREWTEAQRERYMPIIEQQSEEAFRKQVIHDLLEANGIEQVDDQTIEDLQTRFDEDRLVAFDFYPGITEFLAKARQIFTLVVITNGPEFSQIPKIRRVNLARHVDHIIIGGQEPEPKPNRSIFEKAMRLADCEAHEAVHVGDSLRADIAGALNSGITSIWVQHQQPLDAELGIDPHHTVLHPDEIPELIQRIHLGE